jgi:hypothetical protein
LRTAAGTHADANSDSYGNSNVHADANTDCNRNCNINSYCYTKT